MAPSSYTALHTLVAFIFVLTSVQLAKSLTLDVEDEDRFPVPNSEVRLTCSGHHDGILTFSGNPQTEGRVVWTKDRQRVAEWPKPAGTETPSKYELSADTPDYTMFFADLVIRSMDITDNGVYKCRLERGETVLGTSNGERLTVEQRPANQYPVCSIRTLENKRTFICESERGSPPVTLQWWKDGQPLGPSSEPDDDLEDFVQARLLMADDESSRGRFECALTFRGELTRSCILDRPNVTIPTTTRGLSIGQELVVVCITSGNPPVSTVDWNFTPNLHSSVRKEGHVLSIFNISSRDNGTEITCEGHNAVGSNQASTVITLRPPEPIVQPMTVRLEQSEIPTSVDEQAQFKCITTPLRSPPPPSVWHYNGHYVDPLNTTDRFLMEDRTEHVLSVSGVSTLDVGASVTCRIMVSYQPNAEVFLEVSFPQTTKAMTVEPTTKITYLKLGPPSSDTWSLSTLMGFIIGGLMCLVLVGVCCWVSLKAKTLTCATQDSNNVRENGTGTRASCNHLNDDFVVDLGIPPELTARLNMATKVVDEEESPYQDLEDVSRQRQSDEYQRLVSNDLAHALTPESSQR
ncbi:roundabout homolog 1-like [Patiria miniata]|uniref:Ig-like domain-containing protein n=1 Tax=Patiria miniata TaxID=46514 RepID=A0A914ALZ4_PATMI|nr:roundabout homolog 1-like [Patiria miniata]